MTTETSIFPLVSKASRDSESQMPGALAPEERRRISVRLGAGSVRSDCSA